MCTIFTATSPPHYHRRSSSCRNISQQHGTRPCVGNIPSKAVKTNYEKLFNIEMKYSAAGNRSEILQRATPNVCLLIKYLNWISSLLFRSLASGSVLTWPEWGSVSVGLRVVLGQIDNTRQYRIGIKLVSAISMHGPIRVNWQTAKRKHISCMRGHYASSEKENAIYVSLAENCCLKLFSLEPFGQRIQTTCFFSAATADFLSLFFHFCFYLLIFKRYFSDHLFRHWAQQKKSWIYSLYPFCHSALECVFIAVAPAAWSHGVGARTMDVAKNGEFIEFQKFWFP